MGVREKIIEVLKEVEDPELMLDVWSLGLIYKLEVEKGVVRILMTFTTPMCPYGPMLVDMIHDAVKENVKGVKDVQIEITFEPPWTPSDDLRAMFGV